MGVSNNDEHGGGVDGDSSGGNSPSRQGVGTKTSVPWTSSLMATALRNFSWIDVDRFRVLVSEESYRQKSDVRGHPGGPHHRVARPGGTRATTWCGCLLALLRLPFGLRVCDSKIGTSGFVSSNSKNISCITFLKYKTAENRNWHCGILLIG
jgi:hypothetical protein